MNDTDEHSCTRYTTYRLAAATGYSVQQVRDLERLGVIPLAGRQPNGYRYFTTVHVTGLRAYRRLAIAVGPVEARAMMSQIRQLPYDEAIARTIALHADIAHSRDQTLAALRALESIVDESIHEVPSAPEDSMTITELSAALGVRSSTLRFWEQQGLIAPNRSETHGTRSYPPDAVRDARIVTALRTGGYRIPAVQAVIASLRTIGSAREARESLHNRLQSIATQSEALLRAGADISDLLRPSGPSRTS